MNKAAGPKGHLEVAAAAVQDERNHVDDDVTHHVDDDDDEEEEEDDDDDEEEDDDDDDDDDDVIDEAEMTSSKIVESCLQRRRHVATPLKIVESLLRLPVHVAGHVVKIKESVIVRHQHSYNPNPSPNANVVMTSPGRDVTDEELVVVSHRPSDAPPAPTVSSGEVESSTNQTKKKKKIQFNSISIN